MSIFAAPNKPTFNLRLKGKAPWRKKNQVFEPLPEQADDFFSMEPQGAAKGKSAKFRLTLALLAKPPVNLFGYILFFGGIVIGISVLPGKRSHQSHPLINDSIVQSIIVGLVCAGVAIVLWKVAELIEKKRNEIFKREIVQEHLKRCFDVRDYAYNELDEGRMILVTFLESLGIKEGSWNRFTYNDYFQGVYKKSPFIFFDCKLVNHVDAGRNSVDYTRFQGQIILFELNRKVTNKGKGYRVLMFPVEQDKKSRSQEEQIVTVQIEECEEINDSIAQLLSGNCKLSEQVSATQIQKSMDSINDMVEEMNRKVERYDELEKSLESETDPEIAEEIKEDLLDIMKEMVALQKKINVSFGMSIINIDELEKKIASLESIDDIDKVFTDDDDDEVSIDTELLLRSQEHVWLDIHHAAQCEIGIVVSGNRLAIIMQNSFDPFEFGYKEMFSSFSKLEQNIDNQVSWLWSIVRSLETTGWIG